MKNPPKPGDAVEWNSHGGTARGKVEKKLTARTQIKGHTVAASPEDPQFLVKSERGGEAAHKAKALRKTSGSGKK